MPPGIWRRQHSGAYEVTCFQYSQPSLRCAAIYLYESGKLYCRLEGSFPSKDMQSHVNTIMRDGHDSDEKETQCSSKHECDSDKLYGGLDGPIPNRSMQSQTRYTALYDIPAVHSPHIHMPRIGTSAYKGSYEFIGNLRVVGKVALEATTMPCVNEGHVHISADHVKPICL